MTTYLTSQIWAFPNPINIQADVCKASRDIFPTEFITANSSHVLWINLELATIGIEAVRVLQAELSFSGSENHTRYAVILQADQLTEQAQHALLKLLEEPGEYTQIILATSKPQRLLATIRSRCIEQVFSNDQGGLANSHQHEKALEMFDSWLGLRLSEAVTAAEQFKKRDQAKEALENVCRALRLDRMPKSTGSTLHSTHGQLQLCLDALELLGKNINPQLLMEDLLFSLNNLEEN